MEHRRGAALLPLTDAIIETQQVSKAFWVLERREGSSLLGEVMTLSEEQSDQ